MKKYLDHSFFVLTDKFNGYKPNRTGVDTISRFGYQTEHDLQEGFPLLTTKEIKEEAVFHELVWFLRGDSNIKYLVDNNVNIWTDNALHHYIKKRGLQGKVVPYTPQWEQERKEFITNIRNDSEFARLHGDLNNVYGKQWRHWKTSDGKEIDQIADALEILSKSPSSRRIIFTAWNPEDIPHMALPPCHVLYHFNVLNGKLDLEMYQRSADMFLGVPYNQASASAIVQIFAQQTGLEVGRFIHSFGDAHFYCGADEIGMFYGKNLPALKDKLHKVTRKEEFLDVSDWINRNAPSEREYKVGLDHVTAILEQSAREPRVLPRLEIANKSFDKLTVDDFVVKGYDYDKTIRRKMAV